MKKVVQERKESNLWKAVFEKNWSDRNLFKQTVLFKNF